MDSRADSTRDDLATVATETAVVVGHGDDTLSLIVPVFNEHENFPRLVEAVERDLAAPFRLFMVYDFDEDSTLPVAQELARTRPWLIPVRNEIGRGPANALRAGFQTVGAGPALVVMADLSDDLNDVALMLAEYRQGSSVVCASRYMRGGKQQGGPLLKRTLSRLAGNSLYWLAGFPTHDATNNFRLYDAGMVNRLGIDSDKGFEIALELTAKAFADGRRISEVPTTWTDRTAGDSRFRLAAWLPHYLRWYLFALKAGWFPRILRQSRP